MMVYLAAFATGLVIWLCGFLAGWVTRGALAVRCQRHDGPLVLPDPQANESLTIPMKSAG